MNKQKELRSLYKRHWPSIYKCMKKYPGLSGPTVMDISDAYFNSNKRLMIIGQQTYGWANDGSLDALLKVYREFNFGEKWPGAFWSMTHKITDILGISQSSIAWTNLVKCDYKQYLPPKNIENEVQDAFPVLQDELSILAPEIVIFFTGHGYDDRLKKSLPGSVNKTIRNYDQKYLARISHPNLPIKSIRTYHPNYLRWIGKEKEILEYIKRMFNK